ncbi:MAG: efflux RND transporter periplasmic adaptor subunit [Saprospiraceae bacterium]|nr:efflux RND transporter periplasmic adaptor subunit [Saprospiraceae bacterium]
MKKTMLFAMVCLLSMWACHSHSHDTGNGHTHNPDGSHPTTEAPELEPLAYTLYATHVELFVEFKPLVVGQESRFAAHLTVLGEQFTALSEGKVTVSLSGNGGHTVDTAAQPGIFRLRLTPASAAQKATLTFNIVTKNFTDKIVIPDVAVWPDEAAALAAQEPEKASNDISYLKEQAWKTDFANVEVQARPFAEVIRATGQILFAPGDEAIVSAPAEGMVQFNGDKLLAGQAVKSGNALFTVSGRTINDGSLDARIQEARTQYAKAKADYERLGPLAQDKIVSQREYLDAQNRFELAQLNVQALTKNYGKSGVRIGAPISGYIQTLHVTPGQYVQAGQPLATLVKNKRLTIRADVSQQYADKIASVRSANFTLPDGSSWSLEALRGRLAASAKSAAPGSPFIPVFFEMDAQQGFLPGTYVDTYLRTANNQQALTVPKSALIEEQGIFYVYVQTEGESFQKREVKTGSNDGVNVQILSGLTPGERVVSKGAYQIKLSSMSGTMPAHGHEH